MTQSFGFLTVLFIIWISRVLSFTSKPRCSASSPLVCNSISRKKNTQLYLNWQDRLTDFLFRNSKDENSEQTIVDREVINNASAGNLGYVNRLASKAFNKDSSKPSSRFYTTQKVSIAKAHITKAGVEGDYNHYRTLALDSTADRAVSLLTNDVMIALRAEYPNYDIKDGDLGENISVSGISFDFFQVGRQYKFVDSEVGMNDNDGDRCVILEVTEKMDPCANLCKLSYINNKDIEPKKRIARCQEFLNFLDRYDGYRGWYTKVIREGVISTGDSIVPIID